MLTEDEIKRLKNGDKLLAEVKFSGLDDNGEVRVFTDDTAPNGEPMESYYWFEPFELSIPPDKPKYDPCRRFKKGDIVKTVERWGRKVPDAVNVYGYEVPGGPENKEWVVQEAETFGMVEVLCKIRGEYCLHKLPFFHLELVTPVEELEPYMVVLNTHGYHVEGCDGKVLATYYIIIHPNAYEAAKAECKRLNDEWKWRKEHESDRQNNQGNH